MPERILLTAVIPEHLNDVQDGIGNNDEYIGKLGIWKINNRSINQTSGPISILHAIGINSESGTKVIYFGSYSEEGGGGPS